MTREDLMQIPEYKAYLDAHPTEWIDDFIRNRLMEGEEVLMPGEGIWLVPRIREKFRLKFHEWLSKKDPALAAKFKESGYKAAIQWESLQLPYGLGCRGWLFRLEVKREKNDILD